MAKNISKQVAFKISSRTARMLGRQNVSNQHVAIIELIKNAYDADSTYVEVKFENANTKNGKIIIRDNGSGMDLSILEESWLTLGTDYKERQPLSEGGRVRTGAKGIGRFALDRLGGIGVLETFPSKEQEGIRVTVDWSKYDDSTKNFESVTHELSYIDNSEKITGTSLTITQLRDVWENEEFEALHDDLTFLIPPVENYKQGFDINLIIDSNAELSGKILPLVREVAEYELFSTLSKEGKVSHRLVHKQDGEKSETEKEWLHVLNEKKQSRTGKLFEDKPTCGPISLHMLFFLRASNDEKSLDFSLSALRKYLNVFSGIRMYRDGFQIKPYGSKGNDWLGLNGRKARSPEGVGQDLGRYRVSSNQLVGTVTLGREENENLQDKANREGIIENSAFQDLKDFLLDGIRFLEVKRQEKERRYAREVQYDDERLKSDFSKIKKSFENLISDRGTKLNHENSTIELKQNQTIVDTQELEKVKHQLSGLEDNVEAKLQENQLLRALATIGIALSTFSHEIQSSVGTISNEITLTKPLLKGLKREDEQSALTKLNKGLSAAERIQDWSNYVLESVQAKHRIAQKLFFSDVLERILSIFKPSFDFRSIQINTDISTSIPAFFAFPIDLEAILINLISNSVKALESGIPLDKRSIHITAGYSEHETMLHIEFSDSGPGISLHRLPHQKKGLEQIFEPFVTASGESGTGMGLAVINKIIIGLGGKISAIANGPLGGASLVIDLPLKIEESESLSI